MLPLDVRRCAGFLPYTQHDRCPRRPECARYLSRAGHQTPMDWSACEGGDAFVHVDTVAAQAAADHPQCLSPNGVLWSNTLRTVGLLGQPLEAA
jgi:hypothetical protein